MSPYSRHTATIFLITITLYNVKCNYGYGSYLPPNGYPASLSPPQHQSSMTNVDTTKGLLQQVIDELLKRGGMNYMMQYGSSGGLMDAGQQSNCTMVLLSTLKNVGDESRFKRAVDKQNIQNLPMQSIMETTFPFRLLDKESSNIMHHSVFALDVLKEMLLEGGCSPMEINDILRDVPEIEELFKKFLLPKKMCPFHSPYYSCAPGTPYRTSDGSCNNLNYPWWGKSKMPFVRYLPPNYDDYIGAARYNASTTRGRPLPNPLHVAQNLLFDRRTFDFRITNLFSMFAEFVFNDLYATSVRETFTGQPSSDSKSCITFPRSAAAFLSAECTFLPREQISTVTAWLDLSQIYGSTTNETERLRSFEGGLMKTSTFFAYEYPPMTSDTSVCRVPHNKQCFDSGDHRINENMGLTSIYALFIREHNKIASELQRINPLWKDEDLFQEARRISIAQYQHIIYKEFLPVLLGPEVVVSHDLLPLTIGYVSNYNDQYDPTVRNEVSAAVGPSIYTMYRSLMSRYSPRLIRIDEVPYEDIYFNLTKAFDKNAQGLNSLLRGMLVDYAARFDKHFAKALHGLEGDYPTSNNSDYHSIGHSLPAAAIMLGRDHGLASYNDYRQYCGLARLTSFTDLMSHMDLETVALISQLYNDVNDIELFVGGLSELPVTNALLGPTFTCLIAAQFKVLKQGDRFFYEGNNPVTRFSPEQLNEIRYVSMARLLCESVTELPFIQPNVFLTSIVDGNERKPCFTFRRRMMQPWFDVKQVRIEPELISPRVSDLASGIHMINAW
ncbi:hypothetical protein GJ496_010496 [Pomphorhynchus laevis]|nr:hypothetical protein GJ496_010496 [Pomphorhynchus laevis]